VACVPRLPEHQLLAAKRNYLEKNNQWEAKAAKDVS